MNEKTKGIQEPVKMLGFHTKALKTPHVQTLSATLPMTQLCVAAPDFLNRLQISTQHFNITASNAKLRETQNSNTFYLWVFFTSQLKSLRWQKATAKQSYQRIPPARLQHSYTKYLASCSFTNKFSILTQKEESLKIGNNSVMQFLQFLNTGRHHTS